MKRKRAKKRAGRLRQKHLLRVMEDLAALQMKTAEDSLTLAVDSLRIKD